VVREKNERDNIKAPDFGNFRKNFRRIWNMKLILEIEARGENAADLTDALSKIGADLLTHHSDGEVEGKYKYALRMSLKDWDEWADLRRDSE